MQKLINLWLIKLFILLFTIFSQVQAKNISLDSTKTDSINLFTPIKEKEIFKPSLAHKLNPMAYRPS